VTVQGEVVASVADIKASSDANIAEISARLAQLSEQVIGTNTQ
jgi:hypothetical protein